MPVDPDIKKMVDQIMQIMPTSMEGVDPKEFRELTKTYDQMLGAEISIEKSEDMKIPVRDSELDARLYSDDSASDSIIVFYHGGGFVIGDIEAYDSICRHIARYSGSKVISVGYRLAPEFKFPTAVNDAYDSYRWIREKSEQFGANKDKIATMGDSAGGNLCAALSVKSVEDGYPVPALSVLYYPVVAPDYSSESFREFSKEYVLTEGMMGWFHKNYINNDADIASPFFSPMLFKNHEGMPETLVITAEFDPLRDQGETYASTLKQHSVKATCIRATGMVHGFLSHIGISENAKDLLIMGSSLAGHKLRSR